MKKWMKTSGPSHGQGPDLDPAVIYAALDLGPSKARIRVLAPSIAA
jgi:hypothetical protein